jgi:hypothetical protein
MNNDKKTVLIVHCVDTEGPLYEALEASFERIEELYGVTGIEKTRKNLDALKNKEIDLNGKEEIVAQTLNGHLINYNNTWPKIDAMLDRIMPNSFRCKVPDSLGQGWVFSWHCLDHVNFVNNPRRRAMGYHAIFDHFHDCVKSYPESRDALHFHFHPMSTYRDAHRCATSFVNSSHLWETICRRIIERDWFPSSFRAGFQTERPDSNWFLEQWMPFDYSNMAMDDPAEFDDSVDFRNGRSGDWRRAPADWSIYNPSHDDYQIPGNCRRWIARALNVMNRIAAIDQTEVDKAFGRAAAGKPTIMAVATHDFRDLGEEVDFLTGMIKDASERYPDVVFRYCEAVEAFRLALGMDENEVKDNALDLDMVLHRNPVDDAPNLEITVRSGGVFGPQPWLAIETMGQRFIHDNLDFAEPGKRWCYAFHGDTLPLDDVRRIGVGAADKYGNFCTRVIEVASGDDLPREARFTYNQTD